MTSTVRTYTGDQGYLQAVDGINLLFEQGYLSQAEAAQLIKSINAKLAKRGIEARTI